MTPMQAAGKAGPPSMEANVMRMAPSTTRFAYLPISSPAVPQSGIRRLASSNPAAHPSGMGAAAASLGEDAGDYSFAGLESARVGGKGVMDPQRSADSASGSTIEVPSDLVPIALLVPCFDLGCVECLHSV